VTTAMQATAPAGQDAHRRASCGPGRAKTPGRGEITKASSPVPLGDSLIRGGEETAYEAS
jgi:hypothetical protein